MSRTLWIGLLAFGLLGPAALAQDGQDKPAPDKKQDRPDDRFRPEAPPEEEEDLTPEKAMEILKDVTGLMEKAEELLYDSSRGKAIEREKQILEKIDKLLKEEGKENPAEAQKKILKKIQKLMEKSEKSQQDSIEKLGDVIRRVRAQQQQQQQQPGQRQQRQQPQKPQQPQNPATAPYDPNRLGDPVNKFRSRGDRTGRWGDLPARIREAMLSGRRDVDDYPVELQEVLKEFMKKLAEMRD